MQREFGFGTETCKPLVHRSVVFKIFLFIYFLFLKVKFSIEGQHYNGIEATEAGITQEVNAVPKETFERAFDDWCIVLNLTEIM